MQFIISRFYLLITGPLLLLSLTCFAQVSERIRLTSHVESLHLSLLHKGQTNKSAKLPILFLHGSTFPAALAFDFAMSGTSWMDTLVSTGFDTYALDFLGYGDSDRYPSMHATTSVNEPLGRGNEVYKDVDLAVEYILAKTGAKGVILIGHSWGGSVAAFYATKYPSKIAKLVLFAPITRKARPIAPGSNTVASMECLTQKERLNQLQSLTPSGQVSRLEPEINTTNWGTKWLKSDPLVGKRKVQQVCFPSGGSADATDFLQGKSYYDPSAISVPTLIVRGEWDQFPNQDDAELLYSTIANTQKQLITIPKSTHVLHLEKSRHILYQVVNTFILSQPMKLPKPLIAVIFEVLPASEAHKQEYLSIARQLRSQLDSLEGFVSIERFQSLSNPGKILSLSFWRDEESVSRWRNTEEHRMAQQKGRNGIFQDYRLRVVSVIRDYGMYDRQEVPKDSKTFHNSDSH